MNTQTNFDMVLFGATGDLAMRKLLPCLYQAHVAGLLHPEGRILGVSRSELDGAGFLAKVESNAKIHIKQNFSDSQWASFIKRIDYLTVDVTRAEHFEALGEKVKARRQTENVVVYLSTAPKFFAQACENLAKVGLNADNVRVVLEKPLGTDLQSSQQINTDVAKYFKEEQIYRIDHYLGKESLQNLLALRFANIMFEPLWNNKYIASVQLTIAEQLGVEERGEFYDITGALRDMVQNHLMQMLCMTAMERPASLDADAVRDEKVKVIKSLKPLTVESVNENVIRGQYTAAEGMNGYLQETDVPAGSFTETYVAIKAEIENERWAGVPFYLRTGKRMAGKVAEIVLNFRDLDSHIFDGSQTAPNRLVIELQPSESVRLYTQVKTPGAGNNVEPTALSVDMGKEIPGRRQEAYERLLLDVINGKLALFNRRDELEAAWEYVMPILENWAENTQAPHGYPAHSWGPEAARELLARDGNRWHEEQ
ncbi:glucose-6-phosphate dehydrogenase [Neisseria animalis]|uniref:Glucose-6-phosphate 1-dehydrogenase n=1 Tax=Neisseria animalis TaxID=492 RepID=A0A5P3MRT6_NEIAN|nr:glucose-6-phosphate dehydrogenase [Neisseria animalis]QEY24317.1 glucose-6-phosphate dehydrogenase [Neisseria animalis]ROW32372.1 glucose-6-phosphate dehydrogenase [Neisseria animalis]VEE06766.1 glucose-6-phosphate dehydrogenase [Neisseria animalis]